MSLFPLQRSALETDSLSTPAASRDPMCGRVSEHWMVSSERGRAVGAGLIERRRGAAWSPRDSAGLDRLLTEDVVRFSTVRALVAAGVHPSRLTPEWRTDHLGRGAVDLVVGQPPSAAIEFKYPREPVETNAAWTHQLGEMLKDIYRLAALPTEIKERWAVQVVSNRLPRASSSSRS